MQHTSIDVYTYAKWRSKMQMRSGFSGFSTNRPSNTAMCIFLQRTLLRLSPPEHWNEALHSAADKLKQDVWAEYSRRRRIDCAERSEVVVA
jgi:hypothetical protein